MITTSLRLRATSICLAASLWLAAAALAADRQINDVTPNDQSQVDLGAAAVGGDVLYVWTSDSSPGDDISETSIQARRYRSLGRPKAPQQQVNTTTADFQFLPSVAVRSDGSWVVVWVSGSFEAGTTDIYARLYGADDLPASGEILVNDATAGAQSRPAIALDRDDDFLVVWDSKAGAGASTIEARRFTASGSPVASQFSVSGASAQDQGSPAIAIDAAGNMLIAWQHADDVGDMAEVKARPYLPDCDQSCAGVEFAVNTSTTGDQGSPSVASVPDGFVVVWESEASSNARGGTLDGQSYSIQARRFDPSGAPLQDPNCPPGCDTQIDPMCEPDLECEDGNDFQVNTFVSSEQRYPDVSSDPDGAFSVVWDSFGSSGSDSSLYSIQARAYTSEAVASGAEAQLNTYTNNSQSLPANAYNAARETFEFAWQSRGSAGSDQSGLSIPEPGATLLAGVAVGTLGLLMRRRRRRR